MGESGEYRERSLATARRFLRTALVVDDGLEISGQPKPRAGLKAPGRGASGLGVSEGAEGANAHSLDVVTLTRAFAKEGLICSTVAPREDGEEITESVIRVAERADLLIVDWQLFDDDGEGAVAVLTKLLVDEEASRLRLIAIYTGESDLPVIGESVKREFAERGVDFQGEHPYVELSHGHCRIVVYAKAGTSLTKEVEDRAVGEDDIPGRLISDFADMTRGLLPSIALTCLAAVRESAHRVLDRFSPELDPAFLTHWACLGTRGEAQQQVVDLLDSELHAIMDDATRTGAPADAKAVREWLEGRFGSEGKLVFGRGKELTLDGVMCLLECGLDGSDVLSRKDYRRLTGPFAGNGEDWEVLDQRLAWMTNYRTVPGSIPPVLTLGVTLEAEGAESSDAGYFVCMRPKCDSLRLVKDERFLLLPLVEPEGGGIQIVVERGPNDYCRRKVCPDPSGWLLPLFVPDQAQGCVMGEKSDDGGFYFTCKEGRSFRWIGELKAEFAQRIAQHFAGGLSRVATDNSEWLRRHERESAG